MGNLSTPISVQKLQKALRAKAKAEVGYRFYALYDKISRDHILAHASAQCRSNKGAPGVDEQNFADIEDYGVERWRAELALSLRKETYRPDPIRRVYTAVLLRRWLRGKHKTRRKREGAYHDPELHECFGLVRLASLAAARRG
ncbi:MULTISPECIES: hypothetical protein [Novosphingobium]|uniref:hypothetical protein n=1 Tax=Novosphingobium sp. HR1a TaxID=1395637 RepID=UPI001B3C7596|nr:hypothetical protein [Novosphingobium sp. HR1a]